MLLLVHGKLLLGTRPAHGQLLKLLGDGGIRLCFCMTILVTLSWVNWKEQSEQVQDGQQA